MDRTALSWFAVSRDGSSTASAASASPSFDSDTTCASEKPKPKPMGNPASASQIVAARASFPSSAAAISAPFVARSFRRRPVRWQRPSNFCRSYPRPTPMSTPDSRSRAFSSCAARRSRSTSVMSRTLSANLSRCALVSRRTCSVMERTYSTAYADSRTTAAAGPSGCSSSGAIVAPGSCPSTAASAAAGRRKQYATLARRKQYTTSPSSSSSSRLALRSSTEMLASASFVAKWKLYSALDSSRDRRSMSAMCRADRMEFCTSGPPPRNSSSSTSVNAPKPRCPKASSKDDSIRLLSSYIMPP
mmetsp:Transcript_20795/g.63267  ORF Transcript_20795/g.63267 Transcript_20795/m.63267 type:complete len:303 (+) Transcript_20795:285-1193(+)